MTSQTYHHGALREAMIAAAETILERDGIAALTLRAAAREAGVSHGAPAHHFGNLSGLLSELAASGFLRLRQHLLDAVKNAEPTQHMAGLSRGYVAFARSAPGLFRLMFRSEQLDWSNKALSAAGGAAFATLLPQASMDEADRKPISLPMLGNAMAHWSMVHGLSTLLIDGRLSAVAKELAPGFGVEALVEEILRSGVSHSE